MFKKLKSFKDPTTTTTTTTTTAATVSSTTTTTIRMVVCPAAVITNELQLNQFIGKGCTHIDGSLVLNAMPHSVTESLLLQAFRTVTVIRGGLYISNNLYLPSLDCFASLVSSSVVYIASNSGLVDARLPALGSSVEVIVNANRRLCSDNYPRGAGGCTAIDTSTVFKIRGVGLDLSSPAEQDRVLTAVLSLLSVGVQWSGLDVKLNPNDVSVSLTVTSDVEDSRDILVV
jgi:hypothetical protein